MDPLYVLMVGMEISRGIEDSTIRIPLLVTGSRVLMFT